MSDLTRMWFVLKTDLIKRQKAVTLLNNDLGIY